MSNRGHILVAGPAGPALDDTALILDQRGFATTVAPDAVTLGDLRADAVVLVGDPDADAAVGLTSTVCTERPGLPVVLVLAADREELLDAATRAGAFAVLTAPIDHQSMVLAVDRAIEHRALRREVRRLERVVRRRAGFDGLLGSSPQMQSLFDLLEPAAGSDVSVLFTGESGTGKEVAARALHRRSRHSAGPFVPVNVAAVPDGLLEDELFGHARGAFTDARGARRGLFTQADGGTLFLDEIGELSLHMQPKLLRALQERKVRPVGSDREVPFRARILAATNRDLEAMVAAGQFRKDLYYRLAVLHIEVPPLRDRGSDILILANHLLGRVTARTGKPVRGISAEAGRFLLAYRWPGNVRELENVIERAVALTRSAEIGSGDLPARVRSGATSQPLAGAVDPDELVPMATIESRYIRRVLAAVGGNKSRAAAILGFDRKTLYRKIRRYGLDPDG